MSTPLRLWWKPYPLTFAMVALALCCVVFGQIASHRQITSSDPAGNGMATGFVQGFAEVGLQATAILVVLYLLIRWKAARIAFVGLLLILGFGMAILVR